MQEMNREEECRTRALLISRDSGLLARERRGEARKTEERGGKGKDERLLLDDDLEDVLLDLLTNVLGDLLPHLSVLEQDSFTELDSG